MAAQTGDTNELERFKGSETTLPVPYASRGAGLYSEVIWDPVAALRSRVKRTAVKDGGPGSAPPA